MRFGSPIAQAAQPFTTGQYDTLANIALPTGFTNVIESVIAKNSYTAISIACGGLQPGQVPICGSVANSNALTSGVIFSGSFGNNQNGLAQLILPVFCNAGDTLVIKLFFLQAPTSGSLTILGLTNTIPPPVRPDGRCYPLGLFGVQGLATGTIIATPPATMRIMIKHANVVVNQAGVVVAGITITQTGNVMNIAQAACGTNTPTGMGETVDDTGILCDSGTGVALNTTVAASYVNGNILYDLVPV